MMKNVFKKLIPLISLSIIIEIGCRKEDEIMPHQNAKVYPS